jgi:hypothetical protein
MTIAIIMAFKYNEMDKFKSLEEEIEHYCKLIELNDLYTGYDVLLEKMRKKYNDQI